MTNQPPKPIRTSAHCAHCRGELFTGWLVGDLPDTVLRVECIRCGGLIVEARIVPQTQQ